LSPFVINYSFFYGQSQERSQGGSWWTSALYPKQGRIQKIFRGRGFEIFWYRRETLGGFWDFFLKNPSKLKKNFSKGGVLTPKIPP